MSECCYTFSLMFLNVIIVNAVTDRMDKAHNALPDWYAKLCFAWWSSLLLLLHTFVAHLCSPGLQ